MAEPTIYEISSPGRVGFRFPACDVPETALPTGLVREDLPMPEVAELDVVRHFTNLSHLNYSIDSGIYPLGSCTMKYNPKINEDVARLPGFAYSHPLQPVETVQGNLAMMYELQQWLCEISGMAGVTLQPSAGAQGEFTGVSIIRAYHLSRGDAKRTKIIIPDSAHGTNPATSSMNGFEVVGVSTDANGNVDLDSLKSVLDDTVAGLMLTNPNTLGLFDQNVEEVVRLVHEAGGLVYGDGANLNALLGIVRPGDVGFDVMHFNLHKTFSTPHGGGGPGSGPVGVAKHLLDFLPTPVVGIIEEGDEELPPLYGFDTPKQTIGRVKAFHGQFGMIVRAYNYISMHGPDGLRDIAECAVLNANYLLARLRDTYHVPYGRHCMHEFVMEGQLDGAPDVHALDIAKRMMDYGIHPPTNYFPLIVHEALMIEPTETESKQTLDHLTDVLIKIAGEARTNPELLHAAPHNTPVGRLDEVRAAKELVLCCWLPEKI
ncbi:glycine dehydrogenase (decarboxylating) beta subunit [Longilinea arvoryzae]|uniref:Probable glycine dehydrogenase (decarboxylating) subunit 2 n=1 Tax=Longilinea arvoryzae TaxID=360412 RepID=A0A0S7BB28_9CHLR|nr:aminomethyl-transferring glycine dehydrogenase subunit GcvPB [Longilinea arvoryzae]GAP14823.1 glycine dehydrogenase (decarboxylating) beta subunit [Longilinea arvoryzae]